MVRDKNRLALLQAHALLLSNLMMTIPRPLGIAFLFAISLNTLADASNSEGFMDSKPS